MNETGREKELLDSIYGLRLLRDAQDPDGRWHSQFQRNIEDLTTELITVRQVAPEVEQLDVLTATAEQRLRQADPAEDPWSPLAVLFGVIGTVLLLGALWLGWSPLLAAGVLLAAVGALFGSVRYRRDTHLRAEVLRDELLQLHRRRDSLTSATPAAEVAGPPFDGPAGPVRVVRQLPQS
jgi:hypothetical protein